MTNHSSRREFVRQTLLAAAGFTAGDRMPPVVEALALEPSGGGKPPPPLPIDAAVLDAAAAQLIPAANGMPSAAQAGASSYLERLAGRNTTVQRDLEDALEHLQSIARERSDSAFDRLGANDQIAVLQDFERREPARFTRLWHLVYEAYYVNPRILHLMGHELAPTNQAGLRMQPFDESQLDRVRRMPARYRKVPDAR
jgi:hypothetical protein